MLTLEAILRTTRQMAAFGELRGPVPRDRQVPRATDAVVPQPAASVAPGDGVAESRDGAAPHREGQVTG